jgi:hypothetical protein
MGVRTQKTRPSEAVKEYRAQVRRVAKGIGRGTKRSALFLDDLRQSREKIEREYCDKITTLDLPYSEQCKRQRAIEAALQAVDNEYFGCYHKETGILGGWDFMNGTAEWQALTGGSPN